MGEIFWWDMLDSVFLLLDKTQRTRLISSFVSQTGSFTKASIKINELCSLKNIERNYSAGDVYCWMTGTKRYKEKKMVVLIPKFVLIELLSFLDVSSSSVNILGYKSGGKGTLVTPNSWPIQLSPELTSIFFNLLGDGHIGGYCDSTTYRQMNSVGLTQFRDKLFSVFGHFNVSKKTFSSGKVLVPLPITQIIVNYFGMDKRGFSNTFVPEKLFNLPFDNRLAGFCAFVLDEGHINDRGVEVYSHNHVLLNGIHKLTGSLGYFPTKITSREVSTSKTTQHRFRLNKTETKKFANDVSLLIENHPLCGIAHKQEILFKHL